MKHLEHLTVYRLHIHLMNAKYLKATTEELEMLSDVWEVTADMLLKAHDEVRSSLASSIADVLRRRMN